MIRYTILDALEEIAAGAFWGVKALVLGLFYVVRALMITLALAAVVYATAWLASVGWHDGASGFFQP